MHVQVNAGLDRHVHLGEEYESIGADSISVTNRHTLGQVRCQRDRCTVSVRYWLPAADSYGVLPVENGRCARQQDVAYVLRQDDGQWRVDADSLSDISCVSEAGLLAFLASPPEQRDDIELDALQDHDGNRLEHADHEHD